ncbi:DNA repair protein rev1 [Vanrija pseudolonga]|uniref:DNA repair protein REV1 n=1 Tax=Vanrija pseudolonga TaxID=143232 RepID=A0AAF1BJ53_9TREE|nr:DNA repair protein rev1 [Vanrija pseudolonga]
MSTQSSSQSFWAEALDVAESLDGPGEQIRIPKRVQFASYELSPDTPDEQQAGAGPSSPASPTIEERRNATSLEYLPNRVELLPAEHAYLANPEYAPNAFGDVGDYMRKKDIKVQNQNSEIAAAGAHLPQIFAGLTFYINGNTTPPMEELRRMILLRGGTCVPYVRTKGVLDFIVAPVLTLAKFREFARHKVVREGWVLECVAEGRLVDWRKWRLKVEDEGETGLEDFLRKSETKAVAEEEEEEMGPPDLPSPPVTRAIAATQSLLRPVRPAPTVIEQGRPRMDEVEKMEAANPPRPEGTWDNYFVHRSNHHAAQMMKSDEFRVNNTSERGNESGFIDKFYQNSRLHHLSTWKAALRLLVAEARASVVARVPTVLPEPGAQRYYFHVDFDAFFVSAGVASRPHLKGKPVVVCHSSGGGRASTSEVASASYEARALGVKNGMSLGRARQLCGDDLETIPYEFDTYQSHSLTFYKVLLGYADELEAVSVDEALLEVTGAVTARALAPEEAGVRSPDPAIQLADKIRDDIRAETGCEVSIGISHNILLARMATKKAKPAGVFHLKAEDARAFLAELDVDQLPQVGWSTRAKIQDVFGSTLCGALLPQSRDALRRALGPKTGETIYGFLRGQDTRQLTPDKERKSVSAEINYGIRFRTQDQADRYVADLGAEVSKRLKSIGARGRQLTLKIMSRHPDAPIEPPKFLGHGKCETFNKGGGISGPRGSATDDPEVIGSEAVKLLGSMRLDPIELRGVGIQVTKLEFSTGPPKGQGLLSAMFGRVKAAQEARGEEDEREAGEEALGTGDVEVDSKEGSEERDGVEATPVSPLPEAPPLPPAPAVPSDNHVDPEFLAAMPPSIRAELEAELASKRKRKRSEEMTPEVEVEVRDSVGVNDNDDDGDAHVAARTGGRHKYAHITKQLRPKIKTMMGNKAIAELPLYTAWGKRQASRSRSRSVDPAAGPTTTAPSTESDSDIQVIEADIAKIGEYTVSTLRELGIDLDVFAALPADLRAEVVQAEQQRVQLRRSGGKHSAKADSPAKRAKAAVAPKIAPTPATVTRKPALFGARDTSAVAEVLTRWVVTCDGQPADADVARVGKYLVKCVHGWMGGVDHVAVLLRHLRGLAGDLARDGEEEEGEQQEQPLVWWGVIERLKREVDEAAVAKLGAPLRL